MKKLVTTVLGLAALVGSTRGQHASDHSAHAHDAPTPSATQSAEPVRVGDPWPLDACIVSGEKLGSMGDPIVYVHEGREVRFCCEGCVGTFKADPAKHLAKADETIEAQQKASYPLDHCIVDTAESIAGDEAENSYSVVGNRLFVYCCPPCDKKVKADPAKYFEILDGAFAEKQGAGYPLTTCVVSGKTLGSMGETVNYVVANQLVKLCCKSCVATVEKDPATTLAKIADARKAASRSHAE